MARLDLKADEMERLEQKIKEFQGNAEDTINNVLWNEANPMIEESIRRIMPVSGRNWIGKKASAKSGRSLTNENGNLSTTVKTTKTHHYLYFPDDGTNTRRHAGNQQFFKKGAELVQEDIVDRCINRLIKNFE